MCVQQLYSICRNGKSRTQYGECLDQHQWSLHCKDKVNACTYDMALHIQYTKEKLGERSLVYLVHNDMRQETHTEDMQQL